MNSNVEYRNTISACLSTKSVISMWDRDVFTVQIISISDDGDDIFCLSRKLVSSSCYRAALSIVSDRYTDRVKWSHSTKMIQQAAWLGIT